ncbi:hypothetical protein [Mobilicoccus caccae]|uniref:Uncharacterized protein n=1 Tax=Mobilicoccus caccae TaxID=1859295 RepID=A0ABQ6IRU5_9MICO|nr:hypothetical protein GCM10025883_20480 [Mobilicoccus caccae]
MLAPVEWLLELVGVDEPVSGERIAADLVRVGLEEEAIHGGDLTGPLVVGRVLDVTDEPQKNGKTIHFCHVDVGDHGQRAQAGEIPRSPRRSSVVPTTSEPATSSSSCCPAPCCRAGSRSRRARPTATCPTA